MAENPEWMNGLTEYSAFVGEGHFYIVLFSHPLRCGIFYVFSNERPFL